MTPEERVFRARQAEDTAERLSDILEAVHQRYVSQWLNQDATAEAREVTYQRIHALEAIKQEIVARVADGDMAETEIEEARHG